MLSLLLLASFAYAVHPDGYNYLNAGSYIYWQIGYREFDIEYEVTSMNGDIAVYLMDADQISDFSNGNAFQYHAYYSCVQMSYCRLYTTRMITDVDQYLVIKCLNFFESSKVYYDITYDEPPPPPPSATTGEDGFNIDNETPIHKIGFYIIVVVGFITFSVGIYVGYAAFCKKKVTEDIPTEPNEEEGTNADFQTLLVIAPPPYE